MKPVVITIGGSELTTWTAMTLQRSKEELTGSLEVTIFAGAMPSVPLVRSVTATAPRRLRPPTPPVTARTMSG